MPIFKNILIFVEGPDDKRFFEKILRNRIERKYEGFTYHIIKYQEKSDDVINNYINSYNEMNSEIFLFRDFDSGPCISERKSEIQNHFNLPDEKIFIVKHEIESWYLAGLNQQYLQRIGVTEAFNNTEDISKRRFNEIISGRTHLKLEMLDNFKFRIAMSKNSTFRYVVEKLKLN